MDVSVDELATLVGGRVDGDGGARRIRGAASISDAGEGDVTFFANPRYLPALKKSAAGAALVPLGFAEEIAAARVEVANPSLAFAQVLEALAPPAVRYAPGIHPTAVIDPTAVIAEGACVQPHAVVSARASVGEGSVVGANSFIGEDATVGAECLIYPNVVIRERVSVGNRVILHSGVVLGSDGFGFELVQGRHVKIPQTGTVQVDDDVEIGANTSVDRARFGRTWIQEGVKVDNLVQIAHNVVIGKHSLVVAQVGIAGSSTLGQYVTLAGQVGLSGHLEVGDRAIVAAQAGISKDVPAGKVMWGSPACEMGEAKERVARVARLPKLYERVRRLEQLLGSVLKSSPPGS